MWYAIEGHDGPDVLAKRLAARAGHLARHRRVYAALSDMLQTDIHALAIRARTPEEVG